MEYKDEIFEAIEKKRKEVTIVKFFRDPIGVIREKPVRVGYISAFIGGCLMLISYVYGLELVVPYDTYILASIVALILPAYYIYREDKREKDADEEFPRLLADLAQAKRAGLTLIDTITLTAEGKYGILTEGLSKIAHYLTWGIPFEDALRMFAKRYPTRTIKRSVEMIIEGYRVGGEVGDILKIAADDAREIGALEKKRRADMGPYIIICYITFFVFLGVLLVLYYTFIPMMVEVYEKVLEAGVVGRTLIRGVNVEKLKMIFFHCSLIQGVCSGLVAGKLGEGKVIAGLKHAVILMAVAFLAFAFLKFFMAV